MNKETQSIIKNLENILSGQPWFGRAVYEILGEIEESKVNAKPASPAGKPNNNSHSLLELLWHMNTWAEFTLASLENKNIEDLKEIEKNDWRTIDPKKNTWKKGMEQLKGTHQTIIELLKQKTDDSFLSEIVVNRKYNFRFLLNGLIQHNIYHLGQISYLKKQMD